MIPKTRHKSIPGPNDPIGVYDSGVGGLTILSRLRRRLPHENFLYLADQAHVPYGNRPVGEIKRLAEQACRLLSNRRCKIIVVACNTVTCYAIEHLRKNFAIPLIGTVPAIKPACKMAGGRVVAIAATSATLRSKSLQDLIKKYSNSARILPVAVPGLVEMIEGNLKDPRLLDRTLTKSLSPVRQAGAAIVVLGCTHYPFLRRKFEKFSGAKCIDSADGVARQARRVLEQRGLLRSGAHGRVGYFTSGKPADFSRIATKLLGRATRSRQMDIRLS